jgi:predicted membrane channel-forming protein YqfA (hemolysin III family)
MLQNRLRYAWIAGIIIVLVGSILLFVRGFSYLLLGLIIFGGVEFIVGVIYYLTTKKTKKSSNLETS